MSLTRQTRIEKLHNIILLPRELCYMVYDYEEDEEVVINDIINYKWQDITVSSYLENNQRKIYINGRSRLIFNFSTAKVIPFFRASNHTVNISACLSFKMLQKIQELDNLTATLFPSAYCTPFIDGKEIDFIIGKNTKCYDRNSNLVRINNHYTSLVHLLDNHKKFNFTFTFPNIIQSNNQDRYWLNPNLIILKCL